MREAKERTKKFQPSRVWSILYLSVLGSGTGYSLLKDTMCSAVSVEITQVLH